MMVAQNEDPNRTAYTITVDYKHGAQITSQGSSHIENSHVSYQAQRQGYLRTIEH